MSLRRVVGAGLLGAGALTGLAVVGGGSAAADPLRCTVVGDGARFAADGSGVCLADSDASSRARAEASPLSRALAGARGGSTSTALAPVRKGIAVSNAERRSTGYAYAFGPGGGAYVQARDGENALALAGYAGEAQAGYGQAVCEGGYTVAVTTRGAACLTLGEVYHGAGNARHGLVR